MRWLTWSPIRSKEYNLFIPPFHRGVQVLAPQPLWAVHSYFVAEFSVLTPHIVIASRSHFIGETTTRQYHLIFFKTTRLHHLLPCETNQDISYQPSSEPSPTLLFIAPPALIFYNHNRPRCRPCQMPANSPSRRSTVRPRISSRSK
jgi:hypothetical protein